MSIGVIFSITVLFFLVSSLALMTTAAADYRRAQTSKRLQALRGTTTKSVDPNSGEKVTPRQDPYIHFVPVKLRPRMRKMLENAGHAIDLRTMFLIVPVAGGIVWLFFSSFFHLNIFISLALAAAAATYVPLQVISVASARLRKKFLAGFPDAIDLIVRAVKAGLPISAAMEAAGKEMLDPVGKEFRLLIADMRIGRTFDEALRIGADRVDLIEFSFFTASLILQRETGGNLSETLETLSNVLRRRQEMLLKINTLTSEARTSAMVMALLPFFVIGALMFMNPSYLSVLLTDPRGNYLIGAGLGSLTVGIGVMRLMLMMAIR